MKIFVRDQSCIVEVQHKSKKMHPSFSINQIGHKCIFAIQVAGTLWKRIGSITCVLAYLIGKGVFVCLQLSRTQKSSREGQELYDGAQHGRWILRVPHPACQWCYMTNTLSNAAIIHFKRVYSKSYIYQQECYSGAQRFEITCVSFVLLFFKAQ